jgi:hypothetical protein
VTDAAAAIDTTKPPMASAGGRCASCARKPAPSALFVLEPGAHAGVGHGAGDCGRGQLRGVVLHVQPLAHQVRGERLEADEVLEAPLEQRDFFAAIHALDLEGRLGMQFADGAGGGHLFLLALGMINARLLFFHWRRGPTPGASRR